MEKFTVNINLDDLAGIHEFFDNYGMAKGQKLANMLELKGKGSVKLANALSNYAWNKLIAIDSRLSGAIDRAKKYEDICDKIYKEDIQPVCDCW